MQLPMGDMIEHDLFDPRAYDLVELTLPLFWRVVTTSSHWQILGKYAIIVVLLPTAETKNEIIFLIHKNVIRECETKLENDLVIAQMHTRLEDSHIES